METTTNPNPEREITHIAHFVYLTDLETAQAGLDTARLADLDPASPAAQEILSNLKTYQFKLNTFVRSLEDRLAGTLVDGAGKKRPPRQRKPAYSGPWEPPQEAGYLSPVRDLPGGGYELVRIPGQNWTPIWTAKNVPTHFRLGPGSPWIKRGVAIGWHGRCLIMGWYQHPNSHALQPCHKCERKLKAGEVYFKVYSPPSQHGSKELGPLVFCYQHCPSETMTVTRRVALTSNPAQAQGAV